MADTTIEFEIHYLKGEIKSMHSIGMLVPSSTYERLHRLEKALEKMQKGKNSNGKDCRDCTHWLTCPNGKTGHEKGTSKGYSIGECRDFEELEK